VSEDQSPPLLLSPLAALGRGGLRVAGELGATAIFLGKAVRHVFSLPLQFGKIIAQVYFIGVKSLFVISLIGLFTGMVLGLQGYYTLVKFGSEGLLGAAVALSIIRELGPVLTAIMITGRAGSSMAAEIGIMRISEQIDALTTMDIDPVRFLVSPRLAAAVVSFPLLTAVFDVIGILGGYVSGVLILGVNPGVYFNRIDSSVDMADIAGGFYKSLVFAVVVALICCYQGYFTHLRREGFGAKGVSLATTTAVVASCVTVLIADYVITTFLM
jgi:phospholipid/cholesterol/gamma-HCH transport system permease protein